MQTVFAEKTEDRSLDDNRHIGELFFIRMYWEKGRIPSGNILYWKDAKREDTQINFTGFDGLLLYLDETCEQNGVLLRKAQVRRNQKRRRYLEVGKELELVKKSEHAAVFWLKVMGREFASFQGIVHIWGRDYPYRSGFELIILLKDIVGFTEIKTTKCSLGYANYYDCIEKILLYDLTKFPSFSSPISMFTVLCVTLPT